MPEVHLKIPLIPQSGKKNSRGAVIVSVAITIGGAALLGISAFFICFLKRRTSTIKLQNQSGLDDDISSAESLIYSSSTIRAATSNFSDENKLGRGGFGVVYKGLLPDGREIAVKKLLSSTDQGLGELKNELSLVAKLQHRNLVRLLGVCLQEEKLLIYEYVPNRSLDKFLFDPIKRQELQWGTRYKIICRIVRGLRYLHEESQLKIVHRDLKASNILLDSEMNPKIGDFGIAKLFGGDQTHANTSRIVGTLGYMAPEYAIHGLFSTKSDIFSFGILVLEIISGKKSSGFFNTDQDLLSYIWGKWESREVLNLLDPELVDNCPTREVFRCINIALLCVQENPSDRPDMSTVNVMLSSDTVSIQSPSRPAFVSSGKTFVSEENKTSYSSNEGKNYQSSSKSLPFRSE